MSSSYSAPLRRTFSWTAAGATVLSAALLVSGCAASPDSASSPSGDEAITLQTSWVPSITYGPEYLAQSSGYFEDEGLEVEILPGGPDVDVPSLVASGGATIGAVGADNVAMANAAGADLVIVAAGFQMSPLAVISLSSAPIDSPEDMYGKKIGLPTGTSAAHQTFVSANDLDTTKFETVPVGFDMTPLINGEVDGIYGYTTSSIPVIENAGEKADFFLLSDYGLDFFADAYFVKRETLEKNRDMVEAFVRAMSKGFSDFVADPAPAVDLLVNEFGKNQGVDAKVAAREAELVIELILTDETRENGVLTMSPTGIEANVKSLTGLGITGVDSSLFDSSLIDSVYATK